MERVDKILRHPLFLEYVSQNKEWEKERIFCRHNIEHFLDVARIGQILNLEEGLKIEKERIYAAALLHDIGRFCQYESGIGHEEASARLTPNILSDCGFTEEEQEEIIWAIASHRDKSVIEEKNIAGILYRADKLSRSCFSCEAEKLCDWKKEKKNLRLEY